VLHRVRIRASQWALVWAVAFAVVGMHHLGTQAPPPAPTTATVVDCCADGMTDEHAPAPTGHHDMLHLCLAILCAVLVLTPVLVALCGKAVTDRLLSLPARAARLRAPPPTPGGAPARLANLCVLRL
jgi:hypothetical protein